MDHPIVTAGNQPPIVIQVGELIDFADRRHSEAVEVLD
jgi:hypothetical protein